MQKTLYDLMDAWTLVWNREEIEFTLKQVSEQFYARGVIFFLLEEFWDVLEIIDDPNEYTTDDRKIRYLEGILSNERATNAATLTLLNVDNLPDRRIQVLNVDELMSSHPNWFEEYSDGV